MFVNIKSEDLNFWGINDARNEWGGKAANLVRMTRLGLPVPNAFMASASWSTAFEHQPEETIKNVSSHLAKKMVDLEIQTMKKFGAATKANFPLLVSVRSGARVSMPGMMDTILNVGLNDKSVKVLATLTNADFAWDSYRRFIQSYGTTVLGYDREHFDKLVKPAESFCGGRMTAKMSQLLVSRFKVICQGQFPQDVNEQLIGAVKTVFKSWNSERAIAYRNHENIPHNWGTGLVVQEMVFGNFNDRSCTGVLFTRNPTTGTGEPYGDFLPNAQGEDVVDGSQNPKPIRDMEAFSPEIYKQLMEIGLKLENDLQDMCDIEFTVENEKLYILQVRTGKRSAKAARRIPLELLADGVIGVDKAIELIGDAPIAEAAQAEVNADGYVLIGKGLVACDGDIEGVIALSCSKAISYKESGETPILVAERTDPDDMPGIIASAALVTLTGGLVSHAAVVARGWNKPCVVGLGTRLEGHDKWHIYSGWHDEISVGDHVFHSGDHIIIRDGSVYMKRAS